MVISLGKYKIWFPISNLDLPILRWRWTTHCKHCTSWCLVASLLQSLWVFTLFISWIVETWNLFCLITNEEVVFTIHSSKKTWMSIYRQWFFYQCYCDYLQGIVDERWGDWRPHLAMILSNQTAKHELDRKSICTLGDTLGEGNSFFFVV